MQLPFFYIAQHDPSQEKITLDEDTSYHVVQVLRMRAGEKLNLTDGKGNLITAGIIVEHKKHCTVQVETSVYQPSSSKANGKGKSTIAISLLKNNSRFEWFLEKATEIGIDEILPLICSRTQKQKFRGDRMRGICISAMLQSQQCWLPLLHEPLAYELVFRQEDLKDISQRFIAHCLDDNKQSISGIQPFQDSIVLIGPEGDFTQTEIDLALRHQFVPVTLGETRLRTETAGIVAAALLTVH